MIYFFFLFKIMKSLVSVSVILQLAACSIAPGMYMTDAMSKYKNPTPISNNVDAPPAGALLGITLDLVRRQQAGRQITIGDDVKQLYGVPKPYTLGAGDIVNIVVWGHPELVLAPAGSGASSGSEIAALGVVGNGFNINADGFIQFPYVGALKLAGLTENQASAELVKRLAKYIKDPQITLRIQAFRAGRVYVDGEVRLPGLQAMNDIPMTLPEALSRAGGLTSNADRTGVAVTRNGETTMISLPLLAELGINPSKVMLVAGDLVRVSSREESRVFVMGEVLRPVTLLMRNGRLTLNEALGDAGGINPASADPSQIYVVRKGVAEQPEIYHLDARSPAAYALAEGFELKPRDVVYVDPVPLVRWNRVINLILPSSQIVNATRGLSN
jgi:polysaccharide biosynthesis/export protein